MPRKNRIEIRKSKDNKPFVSVKAINNEKLMTSETYSSMANAQKAAKRLEKVIKNSEIVDKTKPKINPRLPKKKK